MCRQVCAVPSASWLLAVLSFLSQLFFHLAFMLFIIFSAIQYLPSHLVGEVCPFIKTIHGLWIIIVLDIPKSVRQDYSLKRIL